MADRRFEAAIFDMDGLILDSEKAVIDCWDIVGERYNLEDIRTFAYSVIGRNVTDTNKMFEERYGTDPGALFIRAEKRKIFKERFEGGLVPLKPYTIELLKKMRQLGMKTALASSSSREDVVYEMSRLGALEYFDAVICGDQVTKSKPDPEIFLLACDALGVKPEEGVGLEDSFNGVRSCKASGLYTIMVPDIIQPDDEIKELADVILPSLKDVQFFLNLK
jgi:HAD superfamily hydrolase (TIGR01509 family)